MGSGEASCWEGGGGGGGGGSLLLIREKAS